MSGQRALAVVLVLLGGVWLVVNGPVEGPVLLRFTAHHGLTTADLLSVVAFVVALWLWFGQATPSRHNE